MNIKQVKANQTELVFEDKDLIVFFSYNTPVACILGGCCGFKQESFYSVTTSKHITQFFNRYLISKADVKEVSQNEIDEMAGR